MISGRPLPSQCDTFPLRGQEYPCRLFFLAPFGGKSAAGGIGGNLTPRSTGCTPNSIGASPLHRLWRQRGAECGGHSLQNDL